jgi:hypothetical protein
MLLCIVEDAAGIAKEAVDFFGLLGPNGRNAGCEADGERKLCLVVKALKVLGEPFGGGLDILLAVVAQERREFIAFDAREDIRLGKGFAQDARRRNQRGVALLVPVDVVNDLEIIEICVKNKALLAAFFEKPSCCAARSWKPNRL